MQLCLIDYRFFEFYLRKYHWNIKLFYSIAVFLFHFCIITDMTLLTSKWDPQNNFFLLPRLQSNLLSIAFIVSIVLYINHLKYLLDFKFTRPHDVKIHVRGFNRIGLINDHNPVTHLSCHATCIKPTFDLSRLVQSSTITQTVIYCMFFVVNRPAFDRNLT